MRSSWNKGNFLNLIGKRFGRLLVIKKAAVNSKNYIIWECLCDCGNIKYLLTTHLRRTKKGVKSCGCLRKEFLGNIARREKGQNGFSCLKNKYKKSAKSRNLSFNLSKEQLMILFKGNCFYCNIEPLQISVDETGSTPEAIKHSEFIYNGIDRLDNTKGYEMDNCASCCKMCNWMKLNFTLEQFFSKIKRIAIFKMGMKE